MSNKTLNMASRRTISFICVFLFLNTCIPIHGQDESEDTYDYEHNIDTYEEIHAQENFMDNHDLDDYDLMDQGYVEGEEDQDVPNHHHDHEHHDHEHHGHEDAHEIKRAESETLEQTIENMGLINPELMKKFEKRLPGGNILPQASIEKEKRLHEETNTRIDGLQKQVEKLEKVDKAYRESISSLLATTAQLRVQIMQVNITINDLKELDRVKGEKIKTLEGKVRSCKDKDQCGDNKDHGKEKEEL